MDQKNIHCKLSEIQKVLKAPKGQYNNFGGYKYRSCEDIIEAVKPLCAEFGTVLTLSDDVQAVGDRFYIKATAMIVDTESGESVAVTAFAREAASKKGMDESQITGTASSYARKYALNGLFCIDDTKDADTDAYTEQTGGGKRGNGQQAQQQAAQQQYRCGECGKPFEAFTAASGKHWTPADVYNYAIQQSADGVARCRECMDKHK